MKKKNAAKSSASDQTPPLNKESAPVAVVTEAQKPSALQNDWLRAMLIVILASVLALTTNAFSRKPVPLLSADGPGAPAEKGPRISVEELATALKKPKDVLLLDVRDGEVFAYEHPTGALNLPIMQFLEQLVALNVPERMVKAKQVVLVCDGEDCSASDRAYKDLSQLRHPNVKVLNGGWQAYVKAGLPTVKAPPLKEGAK